MHRFLVAVVLTAIVLPLPAGADTTTKEVVSKSEFVASWVAALKASGTTTEVEIVDELEITAKAGELKIRANAAQEYESYLAEPATREQQIAALVSMVQKAFQAASLPPDISRIVPVVKQTEWLAKYRLDTPFYPLPGELVVVLVEDRPDEIRYLRTSDLNRLERPVAELFAIAVANLRKVAPVEEHDMEKFVMLSSGGNYEASLMLDATLIAGYQEKFEGEIVFAVPSPDVFVLTGRDDQQGLGGIVGAVCASDDLSTVLSKTVFTAREGELAVVGEVDCSAEVPVLTME